MLIEKKEFFLEQEPIEFYFENKKKGSILLLGKEGNVFIGLDVAEPLYDLDQLQKSLHQYPESFHAGYFSYEALQKELPVRISKLPATYLHEDMIWCRYKKWFEIKLVNQLWQYKEYISEEDSSLPFKETLEEKVFDDFHEEKGLSLSVQKKIYIENLKKIKTDISQGEYYQVNYSFQIKSDYDAGKMKDHFKKYFTKNPGNYFAHMEMGELQILSFSPENFFSKQKNKISVMPIKGTISKTEQVDAKEFLMSSEKDQAELFMITDLFRNDLYRICNWDSVKVLQEKMLLELNNLYHLCSKVEGILKNEITFKDIMRSLFPSGSITGCPKIRSEMAIHQYEKHQRGVYTGSIGYVYRDRAEMNVAIRTAVVQNGKIYYSVGSGIVYDSVPEKEWEECILKAQTFLETFL